MKTWISSAAPSLVIQSSYARFGIPCVVPNTVNFDFATSIVPCLWDHLQSRLLSQKRKWQHLLLSSKTGNTKSLLVKWLSGLELRKARQTTCIENREGFVVYSPTWPSGAKGELVSAADWLYQHTWKNTIFFHVCCYGFSQGRKSLYNTAVYVIMSFNWSSFGESVQKPKQN